jgi:hypothetical protein
MCEEKLGCGRSKVQHPSNSLGVYLSGKVSTLHFKVLDTVLTEEPANSNINLKAN